MSKSRTVRIFAGRTNRDWIVRSASATLLTILGFIGITQSLANAVVRVDPARAYALWPDNGVVAAAHAQQLFSERPDASPSSLPARIATRALLAEPAAADALTVFAFQAELRGQTKTRDRSFGYTLRLSRRELRPQIWAIEEAVSRGDIRGTLRHYDIALRTSVAGRDMLFPILSVALAEPRVRRELVRVVGSKPPWTQSFVHYASTTGGDPEATSKFFESASVVGLSVDDNLRTNLVNAMFAQGKVAAAWDYYASYRVGASKNQSRDPQFSVVSDVRAIFDWTPSADPGVSASILRTPEGGLLDFAVESGTGGTIVRQAQLLSGGRYLLKGNSLGIDQPARSRPYWSLSCQDGRELGRVLVTNSDETDGNYQGIVIVPSDCLVQSLALVARASDEIGGVTGQITRLQLAPTP